MTSEEAIKMLTFTKKIEDTLGSFDGGIKNSDLSKSLAMAIEALGHQPCDDCISRQAAIDAVRKAYENDEMLDGYEYRLGELPSAQPERTEYIPDTKAVPSKRDYVDLAERVTATFFDQEHEEWTQLIVTIADVLDSVCDEYTILPSVQPEPCEDAVNRNAIIQKLNTMDRYVSEELRLCDTDKKFPKNEVFIVDDVYEEIVEILPSAQSEVAKDTNVPSNDCISRQEAIDALYHVDEYNGRSVEAIMNLPSAEPKIGKWILSGGYWRCSECKEKALLKLDKAKGNCKEYAPVRSMFCPNCGVKMLQTDSEPQAEREDNE